MDELNKIDSSEKIDNIISAYSVPYKKSKDEAWEEIMLKMNSNNQKSTKKNIFLNYPILLIAASLIIFILISWFVIESTQKTFYVGNGLTQVVYLPDGSEVKLNSDSYLKYSNFKWKFNRKVSLKGEAYFKVKPGSKFKVISPLAEVHVLGTKFNVYSRNQLFETKCLSGKVLVKYSDKATELMPGDAIKIDEENKISNIKKFDVNNYLDWKNGEFGFENQKLELVFNELGRQFDVIIIFNQEIKNRQYSGYFTNENLEKSLKLVCLPMQLKYTIKDDKTVVIEEI